MKYNIPLLQYLSTYLLPSLMYVYLKYPSLHTTISHHFYIICMIGNIDLTIKINNYNLLFIFLGYITHLIPLYYIKNNIKPNIYSLLLLFLALYVIKNYKYWPYNMSRKTMSILYIILYISILLSKN